ncbi:MAG: 50S ribosomal protein L11 methyltransferase [Bacteroidota bacterium]|nr:50S ribosomal protein L11 methyltransferase [Bacteroidota bacterium]
MPADYIELNIDLADRDALDEMIARLSQLGFDGFWEQDDRLMAYIPEATFTDHIRKAVEDYCRQKTYTTAWNNLPDQNWNTSWESNFNPVMISPECMIRAPFHKTDPTVKFDIIIEPQMSFGTGHHETTSLMVDLMLNLPVKDKKILDMGTGTGILAILAQLMEAKAITAVDNDEWAYKNTLNNINWNNIPGFDVILGNALNIKNMSFDIIFANINRNILLNDMHYYVDALDIGGTLAMSGFYQEDLAAINEKAASLGLLLMKKKSKNNWTAVQYKKEDRK